MISLEDKVAIVTGGSRGIGKAISLKLAQLGAKLVVSSSSGSEDVTREIEASGHKAVTVQADVSKEADVNKLIDTTLKTFGQIDILVNNAGITKDNLTMRLSEADWNDVMDVNLKGTFLCCKGVLKPMMKQRSGKIINMASIIGLIGNPGQTNYSASKAGMIALTKSIAKEIGSRNINVNAIAPGYIETDMTQKISDQVREELLQNIPLKRLGQAEDVANLTAFLASDQANYITGQVFVLDGGLTMTG